MVEDRDKLSAVRTKRQIVDAFTTLLETKPYCKISISDICNIALIHRTTFYNHFYDKNDLFDYTLNNIEAMLFNAVTEKRNYDNLAEMYQSLAHTAINFIDNNKDRLKRFVEFNDFESPLIEMVIKVVTNTIKHILVSDSSLINKVELLELRAQFIGGGLSNLLYCWIKNNTTPPKEVLFEYFNTFLPKK